MHRLLMSVGILSKWGHFLAKFARDALLRDVLLESGQKKKSKTGDFRKDFLDQIFMKPKN